MAWWDDLDQYLSARLDDFLRQHPSLEWQVSMDRLTAQEAQTLKLLQSLQQESHQTRQRILETATEIQRWHERIGQAQAAGRPDLAHAAEARKTELFQQGNQLWSQMGVLKTRSEQAQTLLETIRQQRQTTAQQRPAAPESPPPASAAAGRPVSPSDPLESAFEKLETEQELQALRRKLGL
ncbi:MAG: TIGR04376 family protein [Gloeomargaritaceae cyanobacterium C42_A2020_066]|nr:TIGR04376 family protein [Gloeomargaritaceae cyanobacterium C42_A2020_066]